MCSSGFLTSVGFFACFPCCYCYSFGLFSIICWVCWFIIFLVLVGALMSMCFSPLFYVLLWISFSTSCARIFFEINFCCYQKKKDSFLVQQISEALASEVWSLKFQKPCSSSEAFTMFKKFRVLAEKQCNRTLKILRTDGEGEGEYIHTWYMNLGKEKIFIGWHYNK